MMSLILPGFSPWAPSMTILSIVILRPSAMRNVTLTSPSGLYTAPSLKSIVSWSSAASRRLLPAKVMSRTKGRSVTTKVSLTPPSKSSIFAWTSSKNPSAKIARISSARRAGTKGPPTLAEARPRITASWTRRLPCTARSLTMICPAGGAWPRAGRTEPPPTQDRARAKKIARASLPRAVMARRPSSLGRVALAFRQREARLGDLDLAEGEIARFDIHLDPGAFPELPAHDRLGERILDVLLDRPPQLARPVGRVVSPLDEQVHRRPRGLELDALVRQLLVDAIDHELHDRRDVLP